jgi:hypothetical protein
LTSSGGRHTELELALHRDLQIRRV